MHMILRAILFILTFAILVNFSPLIILAAMIAVVCGKGENFKEKCVNVLDKLRRILQC